MIGARELDIAWGDNPCHWKWISQSDSSFVQVAKLEHVWWLEIRGTTETTILSPKTTYVAYLVIKFTKDDDYGLNTPPTDVLVEFIAGGGTASGARTVYLDPIRSEGHMCNPLLSLNQ
ncbi:F-box protein pp2-b1 [Thalictrum thalictroides]|uniref:F-box protein pp2-b1 n=1 Tax=Thalictrum thalictroides TaxID=46969 RepID=A0A7J6V223_THATH|nr:F-box protein pp2-b1 [Thalictrum thalictroides]